MKVILLDDIENIGKKYDVKNLADGYVRNFLLPKKLVRPATAGALKELENLKARVAKDDSEVRKHLSELARKLEERHLEFELKVDESGTVFGSVTKETILKGLRDTGLITKERVEIKIDRPLKEIGEHAVEADLKKGIKARLKVVIRPRK